MPVVTVMLPLDVKALLRVHVAVLAAFPKITEPIVFPDVDKTQLPLVALNDQIMDCPTLCAASKIIDPKAFICPVPTNDPVNPVALSVKHCCGPVTVTVTAPDAASKYTSSALVGTEAPPAPPDVAAHFVPAVASQIAVPPTQ